MTTSVSKATIIENIWKNFYDRITSQVKTTTITGGTTVTVQNYVSSFPDRLIDSKSDYPIIIIENPTFASEDFTMTRGVFEIRIGIEAFTNQAESADKFLSQIMNAVETYRRDLKLIGISKLELDSTSSDRVSRDALSIHTRRALFKFRFHYDKTLAF